jgi:hypothetical protein
MPPRPARIAGLIPAFAPLFVHRSWRRARPSLIGAILTPGRRTVTSVLRILGRAQGRRFVNVHRIFSHSAWCWIVRQPPHRRTLFIAKVDLDPDRSVLWPRSRPLCAVAGDRAAR